jgi:hypothetical protein
LKKTVVRKGQKLRRRPKRPNKRLRSGKKGAPKRPTKGRVEPLNPSKNPGKRRKENKAALVVEISAEKDENQEKDLEKDLKSQKSDQQQSEEEEVKSQKLVLKDELVATNQDLGLEETLNQLLEELKKFNGKVEKDLLESGTGSRIREGRVLPPLLRSLQLLLARPNVVVRAKIPGIVVETEDLNGKRRIKFGVNLGNLGKADREKNQKGRQTVDEMADKIVSDKEEAKQRCILLRQFGIMWLAPFCHLNPITGILTV